MNREQRGMAPLIFKLSTGAQWLVSRPGPFTPEKEPWYPSNGNLDGPQSRSGCSGKNENLLSPTGIQAPDGSARSGAFTPITLLRLSVNILRTGDADLRF